MFRRLLLIALVLGFAAPAVAQGAGTSQAEREYSYWNADRAYHAGVLLYRAGRTELAIRQFERAVLLVPDEDRYRRSLTIARTRYALELKQARAARVKSDALRRQLDDDDPDSLESMLRQTQPGEPGPLDSATGRGQALGLPRDDDDGPNVPYGAIPGDRAMFEVPEDAPERTARARKSDDAETSSDDDIPSLFSFMPDVLSPLGAPGEPSP